MKKILIFILFVSSTICMAQGIKRPPTFPVALSVHVGIAWDDPENPGLDFPRSPVPALSISQFGHTIYFDTMPHPAFTVTLLDIATGEVMYETTVGENDATLVLPSSFTGDYEIRLAPSDAYYYGGEITL